MLHVDTSLPPAGGLPEALRLSNVHRFKGREHGEIRKTQTVRISMFRKR